MSKFASKPLVAIIAGAAQFMLSAQAQVLEEVIVTAQKREESLQSTPISITALTANALTAAGVGDIKSLEQVVPGFFLGSDGPYTNPTIRGVGSTLAGAGQSANVAIYVDGFYRPSQMASNLEFIDVDSVQVVKGPQGTLFGRNATGGAVLVTTRTPSFSPQAEVRASYARFNDASIAAYGTAPLTETLAGSLSVFYHAGDGFIENVVTGSDDGKFQRHGARGKLLWNASDRVSVLFGIDHNKTDDPIASVTGLLDGRANAVVLQPLLFPSLTVHATDGARKVANDADTEHKIESTGASIRIDADLDWATLTSYTQYRDEKTDGGMDLDGTNAPMFAALWSQEQRTFTQEINLSADYDDFDWVLGAYYFRDDSEIPGFNVRSFGLADYLRAYGIGTDTSAWALYGDATWNFAPQWFLTLGMRYSSETQDAYYETAEWFEQGHAGMVIDLPRTFNDKTWTSFTPRLVLRYELSDMLSIYGSVSEGFKSGAFNTAGFQDDPADPEEITAYELGLKAAADSWRLETALFYYDYTDLQTSEWSSTTSFVRNAAKAEIYGAEFHLATLLTDSLSLDLSGAYTHGRYDEFTRGALYDWSPAEGGVVLRAPFDVTDNKLTRTPEFAANIGITYNTALGSGELTANINYAWQSRLYFDVANTYSQDPYGLVNGRITWDRESSGLSLALFGTNLTDEEYSNQIMTQSLYIGRGVGQPRSFGIEVSQRF